MLSIVVFVFFAFNLLPDESITPGHWSLYVNPLNHYPFFLSGFIMAYFKWESYMRPYYLEVLGVSVVAFIFFKVEANELSLVHGINRVFFTFLSVLVSLSFASINLGNSLISRVLTYFGDISYSLYLSLVPVLAIMKALLTRFSFDMSNLELVSSSVIVTVFLSHMSYRYYEKWARDRVIIFFGG